MRLLNPQPIELRTGLSAERRASKWGGLLLLIAALVAGVLLLRLLNGTGVAQIRTFTLVTSSLLIEAIPFILLGAIVGAAIQGFVPTRAFEFVGRLPRLLQLPVAGLGGIAFPVCECGSVPVARRLAIRGLSAPAAVTFMLAAPIVNPVVLWSTAVAYRGRDIMWPMLLGRAGLGLVTAMIVGAVVGNRSKEDLLRFPEDVCEDCDHHGDPGVHDHGSRGRRFISQVTHDFISLGRYLVIGASVAGALQTFLPQSVIASVASTPVVSVFAMMVLAAALSLCSESDAFVAASFVQFGFGPQLGFLVVGPMIDTKLGFLYAGTFRKGFLPILVLVVTSVALVGSLLIDWLVK